MKMPSTLISSVEFEKLYCSLINLDIFDKFEENSIIFTYDLLVGKRFSYK